MRKFGKTDKSKFPIITLVLDPFEPTIEEFKNHLDELSEFFDHPGVVVIMDISDSKFLPSEHRIAAGNWFKKDAEKMRKNGKGFAFVNRSVLMGIILKGVLLVSKPSIDYTVTSSMEEAHKWAKAKLK